MLLQSSQKISNTYLLTSSIPRFVGLTLLALTLMSLYGKYKIGSLDGEISSDS